MQCKSVNSHTGLIKHLYSSYTGQVLIILLAVSSPKQPIENFTEEEPRPREEPKKTIFTPEEITPFPYMPGPPNHIYLLQEW